MDKIQVIDKFFDDYIVNEIKHKIKNSQWECDCIDRESENREISFAYWFIKLDSDTFFNKKLLEIIENKLKLKLKMLRIIAVSQMYGQNICYHTDNTPIHKFLDGNGQDFHTNDVTICLYINDDIDDEINGNIYFKIPNEKYIISVEPITNRCICFPGYLLHAPKAFTTGKQRICITWKCIYE